MNLQKAKKTQPTNRQKKNNLIFTQKSSLGLYHKGVKGIFFDFNIFKNHLKTENFTKKYEKYDLRGEKYDEKGPKYDLKGLPEHQNDIPKG